MVGPSGCYVSSSNQCVFAFGMIIVFEEAAPGGLGIPLAYHHYSKNIGN